MKVLKCWQSMLLHQFWILIDIFYPNVGRSRPPPVPPGCLPILTTINLELPLQLLGNQSMAFFHFLRILLHLFLLHIYFPDRTFSRILTAMYWHVLAPLLQNCTELLKIKGWNRKNRDFWYHSINSRILPTKSKK